MAAPWRERDDQFLLKAAEPLPVDPLATPKTDAGYVVQCGAPNSHFNRGSHSIDGPVATILAYDARGWWASSGRLAAHAALSNKSAMTTAWPRIS